MRVGDGDGDINMGGMCAFIVVDLFCFVLFDYYFLYCILGIYE